MGDPVVNPKVLGSSLGTPGIDNFKTPKVRVLDVKVGVKKVITFWVPNFDKKVMSNFGILDPKLMTSMTLTQLVHDKLT